jgi:hypothetical protein
MKMGELGYQSKETNKRLRDKSSVQKELSKVKNFTDLHNVHCLL